ncbi:MAG: DUF6531 domain-containing protein, partial [Methylobacter sp.]
MRKIVAFLALFFSAGFASADTYPANLSYYGQSFSSGWVGQQSVFLYASSPAGVCDALLAEVITNNPGLNCSIEYFTTTPNCRLFRNSDHGGLGYRNVGSFYTCPNGGTLSGTSCINAPACAPLVRNVITGECGVSPKNNGGICPYAGNPISISTGNKWQHETDLADGAFGLTFDRYYNASTTDNSSTLGAGWTHAYTRSSTVQSTGTWVTIRRNDGKAYNFQQSAGVW